MQQLNETIDYNEHFEFGVLQGRVGFGSQGEKHIKFCLLV